MKKKIIITCLLIVASVVLAFTMRNICNRELSVTEALYSYNGADVYNEENVREISEWANVSEYDIEDVDVRNEGGANVLTVEFKVDDRSKHRHIDEESLNKMAALIFALVPNADEIRVVFYDDYKNVKNVGDEISDYEVSFNGFYYSRRFLYERTGMEAFRTEYIAAAANTFQDFEKYYDTVMAIEVPEEKSLLDDAVYKIIGNDCEVLLNSGIRGKFTLDAGFLQSGDYTILSNAMPDITHTIEKHIGKEVELLQYHIRNFKTDEYSYCSFLYYMSENGVVMLDHKFHDNDKEIQLIRNLISKYFG